jgi:hypothetical protein
MALSTAPGAAPRQEHGDHSGSQWQFLDYGATASLGVFRPGDLLNSNATIVPGVYDVDTSAGTVTLTDDSGRRRPPFRFDVARHSGMMPPTVPG